MAGCGRDISVAVPGPAPLGDVTWGLLPAGGPATNAGRVLGTQIVTQRVLPLGM